MLINNKAFQAVNKFVSKRLQLMKQYGIKAICVFDGNKLPSKRDTNESRRAKRSEAKVKAIEALKNGDNMKAYGLF